MPKLPESSSNSLSDVTDRQMTARAKYIFRRYQKIDRINVPQKSWRRLSKELKQIYLTEASYSYNWLCE